jgi:hypothetical protein
MTCGAMSPRPESAFASPPPKRKPTVKRDTADEAAEKRYVRERDRGCVAKRLAFPQGAKELMVCDGPLEIDHVRASGGLGMKSPTHRTNLVQLCRWHHRLKTDYGKVWRPLLIAYLERVEAA